MFATNHIFSDPEPSADDFERALKYMFRVKENRDAKAKAKQTATTNRQAQISRALKESEKAAPKPTLK